MDRHGGMNDATAIVRCLVENKVLGFLRRAGVVGTSDWGLLSPQSPRPRYHRVFDRQTKLIIGKIERSRLEPGKWTVAAIDGRTWHVIPGLLTGVQYGLA